MSVLRDKNTGTEVYRAYASRVHRYALLAFLSLVSILVEEGACELPGEEIDVETPCGIYKGFRYPSDFVGVSIMRSGIYLNRMRPLGDALLQALIDAFPSCSVGKVLVQRDESSEDKHAQVKLFLSLSV